MSIGPRRCAVRTVGRMPSRSTVVGLEGMTTRSQNLKRATLDRLNILAGILLVGLGAALCAGIV
jgi:hypothetical protein